MARRARKGDRRAQEQLALHNLGLVVSVAANFRGRGIRLDDLVQEGSCGLVKAVERFDPERGHRFCTYAIWWIRAYVTRALRRGSSAVAPSMATKIKPRTISLDDPVVPGGESTYLELLADEGPTPDQAATRTEMRRLIRRGLARVRSRMGELAWKIIMERLSQDEPRTLEQIGEDSSLSRERVRQLEMDTRKFLGRYLADFAGVA